MSVKISIRFKIFERDNFTCQYCGKKTPQVILHLDHIHPKSKGGSDDEINLITSCQDCNLGKRDKILKNPKRVNVKKEIENLKEVEKQIKEYYKYLKKVSGYKKNNPIVDLFCNIWEEESGGENSINENGKRSLEKLLKNNDAEDIIEAIKISWENIRVEDDEKWRYMHGILKNLKLKRENPREAKQIEEENKQNYIQ